MPVAPEVPFFDHEPVRVITSTARHALPKDTVFSYSPFGPFERVYWPLLYTIKSNVPWMINSSFIFDLCHILEESVTFFSGQDISHKLPDDFAGIKDIGELACRCFGGISCF